MEISASQHATHVTLAVNGCVNIQTSPQLHQALRDWLERSKLPLMVLLREVEYMDSSGVGVLVSGMKMAKEKGVYFALVDVAKRVQAVLEITKLVELFNIYQDVPAALERVGQ